MSAQPHTLITTEMYLALEEQSDVRHEYYAGHVFALAGGSENHTIICVNILTDLNIQLRARACTVYNSDMKLKIERTGLYTYPDVAVVCGPPRFDDAKRRVLLNPTIIIEVLSESTERYDRGRKFQHYRSIETLQEYLLVAQDAYQIDHYVRQPGDLWLLSSTIGEEARIELASIGCVLTMHDVYLKVDFSAESGQEEERE